MIKKPQNNKLNKLVHILYIVVRTNKNNRIYNQWILSKIHKLLVYQMSKIINKIFSNFYKNNIFYN